MHIATAQSGTAASDGYLYSKRHAWYALFLLFVLMLFDFIDRQVLSSLLPFIKAEWKLSDTELGALVSVVNVAIALLALLAPVLFARGPFSIVGMPLLPD